MVMDIINKNSIKIKFRTFSYLERYDRIIFLLYEEIVEYNYLIMFKEY